MCYLTCFISWCWDPNLASQWAPGMQLCVFVSVCLVGCWLIPIRCRGALLFLNVLSDFTEQWAGTVPKRPWGRGGWVLCLGKPVGVVTSAGSMQVQHSPGSCVTRTPTQCPQTDSLGPKPIDCSNLQDFYYIDTGLINILCQTGLICACTSFL